MKIGNDVESIGKIFITYYVFQYQIPANDKGNEFTYSHVAVNVRGSCLRYP